MKQHNSTVKTIITCELKGLAAKTILNLINSLGVGRVEFTLIIQGDMLRDVIHDSKDRMGMYAFLHEEDEQDIKMDQDIEWLESIDSKGIDYFIIDLLEFEQ